MQSCSVIKKMRIVPGTLDDYRQLAHYHYRDSRPGPFKAIFALKPSRSFRKVRSRDSGEVTYGKAVGVIVYSMPSPRLELRNVATDNFFAGFDRSTQLELINRNVRRISRVIVEPRYRGLGLACRLVKETMPEMNVPIIEAMAVMGLVNPFFVKAGMKAYTARIPVRNVRLLEALSTVGIEERELLDSSEVQRKFDRLTTAQAEFVEHQIMYFLKSYDKRRSMPPGLARTRYILSKLTVRPNYYIWFNPKFDAGCSIPDASPFLGGQACQCKSRVETGKENR